MACTKKCLTLTTKLAPPADWKLWQYVDLMCAVHCKLRQTADNMHRICYCSLDNRCDQHILWNQNVTGLMDSKHWSLCLVCLNLWYTVNVEGLSIWNINIQVEKVIVCPKVTKISFSFVHIVNHTMANTSKKKYWRNVINHNESVCIDSCSLVRGRSVSSVS